MIFISQECSLYKCFGKDIPKQRCFALAHKIYREARRHGSSIQVTCRQFPTSTWLPVSASGSSLAMECAGSPEQGTLKVQRG